MATGKINHIGEVFGNLEVVGEAEGYKQPSGKFVKKVLCKCLCGTEKIIVYKDLKSGDTKSCGCYRNSFKNDIVKNNVYGLLTIIEEVEKYISPGGAKTRRVLCECACGKKKEYNLQTLKSGNNKDCGCVFKKEVALKRKIKEDITVKKEVTLKPEDTKEEQWKESIISSDYLVSTLGRMFSTKSNNYLNTNRTSIRLHINKIEKEYVISKIIYETFIEKIDTVKYLIFFIDENNLNSSLNNLFLARRTKVGSSNWVTRLYAAMKTNGKEKLGQRFKERTVSKKQLIDLYKEQKGLSYFLGIKMDMTCSDKLLSVSVDRIDNDKDYIEGNIRLVTRFENMGRRDATSEEFSNFCKKLKYNNF
jgi:hypothetical protein